MILVTGGLGMIGAHTARALIDLGHEVVVTSHRRAEVPSFLAGKVTVESLDVTDRDAFLTLAGRHDISDIVHLASTITGEDPVDFFRTDTTAHDTGFAPTFDVTSAVADYVAWRAGRISRQAEGAGPDDQYEFSGEGLAAPSGSARIRCHPASLLVLALA